MQSDDNGREDLIGRLHALGAEPVEPTLMAAHLGALRGGRRAGPLRRRLAVAVAGVTVLGGGSLAWAGELPDPAQDVAHRAARAVGLGNGIPPGHDRVNDAGTCGIDPETQTTYRNHGQYVRDHQDDPEAGKSPCGKPRKAVEHPNGDDPTAGPSDETDDDGNGRGRGQGKTKAKAAKPDDDGEAGTLTTPTPGNHPGEGDGGPPPEVPPQQPGNGEGTPPADPGEGEGSPPTSVPPVTIGDPEPEAEATS